MIQSYYSQYMVYWNWAFGAGFAPIKVADEHIDIIKYQTDFAEDSAGFPWASWVDIPQASLVAIVA